MTPEEISAYLRAKGFDDDSTQSAVLSYLTTKSHVRFPKAWCWKAAVRFRQNAKIKDQAERTIEPPQRLSPTPLQVAAARQELARTMANLPKQRKGWPPLNSGPKAWTEDYQALLNEP